MSTSIDQYDPSTSIPLTQKQEYSRNISQGCEESPKAPTFCDDPLHESLHEDSTSQGSSSNVRQTHTSFEHHGRWTKDHHIANVIGDPSRSVSTRKQLQNDAIPDIVHATSLCARYQAKPTEKHLKEVKRIFRYLRGTANTGLWYSKDSGFELTGISDADYAGCKDTFKSTSGEAQFLGEKLVS
nr:uncharacterized mitochondrial protein AtMg00810-like [Tanacetum cinerariifolium]